MEEETVEKLKKLVEKRKSMEKVAGGEIFAMWGILNIIAFTVFNFIRYSILVWVVMISVGIITQILYVRYLESKSGFRLFWTNKINELWIYMIVLLPFIFFVFPFLLKIYDPWSIFPLISLWISIGMFASGIIVNQLSMKIGGFVFLISSILTVKFLDLWFIIYPASVVCGLIIPGIWSKYEEKNN
jgi:hypothetical protein